MILKYLMRYMVVDFLLDQKAKIDRLDAEYKKASTSEARKIELEEQKSYLYAQGLQAMRRFKQDLPKSIREFYLTGPGNVQPDMSQVLKELKMIHRMREKNRVLMKIIVASIIIILILAYWT